MAHLTIDRYITTQYENWLSYARYQCFLKRIGDVADEVLSDAVLVLLSKSEQTIIGMINEPRGIYTRLDLLMSVIIRHECINKLSRGRYIDRHTVKSLDVSELNIAQPDVEDHTEYDICGKMNQLRDLLLRLNVSERRKKTFESVVLDGRSAREFPCSFLAVRQRVNIVKKALRQAISNC